MGKRITTDGGMTIGVDLGDRWTEGRVLNASGEVIEAFRVRTTEPTLTARLSSYVTDDVDAALFALEPEDIHLEYEIPR